MEGFLDVVRGRRVEPVEAVDVIRWLQGFDRTVVDLGTGDGRWAYRQARRFHRTAFVGIDANADRMRETSFRAGRRPARGGVCNLLFVRASLRALPQALTGVADEVYVLYPWGSLLDTVWVPQPDGLRAIMKLVKPEGRLEVHINASAVGLGHQGPDALAAGYAEAGIRFEGITLGARTVRTSWAARTAHGRDPRILVLTGTAYGDSNRRPQG